MQYKEKMRDEARKEFHNSLDLIDQELEAFLPQLLHGLWELGSMPDYIVELIKRDIGDGFSTVVDFGCGKGAVLIKLAQRFDFHGVGIDIVGAFIDEAKNYARQFRVADKLEFKREDIRRSIGVFRNLDIAIYGYDSEILGELQSTILQLSACVKDNGYIVLEFATSDSLVDVDEAVLTEREMLEAIGQTDCILVDRIDWSKDKIREANKINSTLIKGNVNRLINLHPDKGSLFEKYFQNQLAECEALENIYTCSTLLLRKRTS